MNLINYPFTKNDARVNLKEAFSGYSFVLTKQ